MVGLPKKVYGNIKKGERTCNQIKIASGIFYYVFAVKMKFYIKFKKSKFQPLIERYFYKHEINQICIDVI